LTDYPKFSIIIIASRTCSDLSRARREHIEVLWDYRTD